MNVFVPLGFEMNTYSKANMHPLFYAAPAGASVCVCVCVCVVASSFCKMARIQFTHSYNDIISVENLLLAWKEFIKGKKSRKDVLEFERYFMANIILLHRDLAEKTYRHSPYEAFMIFDPKPRDIHKASVRDRLLHHALYRKLYPFFDRIFTSDSTSCRMLKGTHRASDRFKRFAYKVSQNHTRTAWVLKCDIRKFFASIDQKILLNILGKYIQDENISCLLEKVISSFHSKQPGIGLPLGNLTSQLLVNVYMNEFDQFVKHRLKAKYYIRYADDFVILSADRSWLKCILPKINEFLRSKLCLELHPDKVSIRTISSGVDYLGWVNFPDHRVLRTVAKKRMFRRLKESGYKSASVQSYYGLLKHGNSVRLKEIIESEVEWLSQKPNEQNSDLI